VTEKYVIWYDGHPLCEVEGAYEDAVAKAEERLRIIGDESGSTTSMFLLASILTEARSWVIDTGVRWHPDIRCIDGHEHNYENVYYCDGPEDSGARFMCRVAHCQRCGMMIVVSHDLDDDELPYRISYATKGDSNNAIHAWIQTLRTEGA
jgi:hypothetical protein